MLIQRSLVQILLKSVCLCAAPKSLYFESTKLNERGCSKPPSSALDPMPLDYAPYNQTVSQIQILFDGLSLTKRKACMAQIFVSSTSTVLLVYFYFSTCHTIDSPSVRM